MWKRILLIGFVVLALGAAYTGYTTKVYMVQGGDEQVVASGGKVRVESGGEVDVESGGALKLAGTAVTSTAAELNVLDALAATNFVVGNVSNVPTAVAMGGDGTLSNAGALTIATGAVEDSMIEALADGEILIGVDGTAANNALVTMSGDATLANDGALTIAAGAVDDAMLASRLVKRPARKAWGALYMTGISVDEELLTIGGRIYGVDVAKDGVAGADVAVEVDNTTADELVTKMAAAINADGQLFTAVADMTNDILFVYADTAGVAGNSITLVEGFTNGDVSAATLVDGADAAVGAVVAFRHTITTTEATGGAAAAIRIDTGLTSIESVHLSLEDNAVEAIVGVTITVSGGVLTIVEGTPAWANADVLNILVVGTE